MRDGTVESASDGRLSNGDGVSKALAILDDPDRRAKLSMIDRVSLAVIVECGGDGKHVATYEQVAERAHLSVETVITAFAWIAEHHGLPEDRPARVDS